MVDKKPKLRVVRGSAPPSQAEIEKEKKWAEFTRALEAQRAQTSGDVGELIADQVALSSDQTEPSSSV